MLQRGDAAQPWPVPAELEHQRPVVGIEPAGGWSSQTKWSCPGPGKKLLSTASAEAAVCLAAVSWPIVPKVSTRRVPRVGDGNAEQVVDDVRLPESRDRRGGRSSGRRRPAGCTRRTSGWPASACRQPEGARTRQWRGCRRWTPLAGSAAAPTSVNCRPPSSGTDVASSRMFWS